MPAMAKWKCFPPRPPSNQAALQICSARSSQIRPPGRKPRHSAWTAKFIRPSGGTFRTSSTAFPATGAIADDHAAAAHHSSTDAVLQYRLLILLSLAPERSHADVGLRSRCGTGQDHCKTAAGLDCGYRLACG